jgi:hypothetical protein
MEILDLADLANVNIEFDYFLNNINAYSLLYSNDKL